MSNIWEQCLADNGGNNTEVIQCMFEKSKDYTDASVQNVAAGVDTFYLIFAGALVYFMQTGFAMLCAGSIRAKNCKNVLLWNLLDSCGGALAFWSVGYAFAYGGDTEGGPTTFIGNAYFFLIGLEDLHMWFFQFAFACALSSIVAGTVAERCKMQAYLLYSTFLCGFVYPVAAHSFWAYQGFLSPGNADPLFGVGAVDLAGSGPVHMTGGVLALVMAVILGPRMGRFYDENGAPYDEPRDIPGHSVALQFLGTFCLWFGWYGFNPGSTLTIASSNRGSVAALAAVNTSLGAAAGAVSAMFTASILEERRTGVVTYDLTNAMNGCLTGLVAVTAPCASVEPWAGFLIGVIAGWVYLTGSWLLVKYKIDDAVDAIPVHMGGGMWGVLSTGLFSSLPRLEEAYGITDHIGWFYEWGRGSANFNLMGAQIVAVLFVIGWVVGIMGPYIWVLNYFGMLRIDPLEEKVGMDISRHKGPAYVSDADNTEHVMELEQRRSSRQVYAAERSWSGRLSSKKQKAHEETNQDEPAVQDEEFNA
eukprot:CAMPEP_0197464872 /NCGR_PEP_ID=MMETSP1175-20131217/64249_1 /TAXON_ID=1003142 /ORGANISM="Triceratium dubium, Strain CCMP147" /LENGTH=531 /DNA_ID=CAMNT_0043000875 /DNA_START=251 /DNA_END=1846 /DNA_ORIENTATION=+